MINRHLYLELMDGYRYRGELLAQIRHRMDTSAQEDACIALHDHWDEFVQAERWNHAHQRRCPSNVADALELIVNWYQAGSPKVFGCKAVGAVWYAWRQAKLAVVYVIWEALDVSASLASVIVSMNCSC